jgi:hypothetical protein
MTGDRRLEKFFRYSRKKCLEVFGTELAGVALSEEQHKPPYPIDISLLGADTMVLDAQPAA